MHIVMLSDAESFGGAAIAAGRLATALSEAGHAVTRVVLRPDDAGHPWRTQTIGLPPRPWRKRLRRRFASGPTRQRLLEDEVAGALARELDELAPDAISIHNLHLGASQGWSIELAAACAHAAPTAWTLHDMWSFTGRCAYSFECRRFESGCTAECPTPDEYPPLPPKRIAPAWEQRRRVLEEHPGLAAVAPSRWMAREAASGLWRGHRVEVIPNGLPLAEYRPLARTLAREALGIPTEQRVLLVSAHDLRARRKGGEFLAAALQASLGRPVTLLMLGSGAAPELAGDIRVHALGYVDHERTKVLAYNAADLLLHPAPVDNLPNVVLEAMACGTPTVAFPIGGLPDMVRPGVTGWLAAGTSGADLRSALENALRDLDVGVDLRAGCRATAEAEYDARLQAERYVGLFQALATRSP